MTVKQSVISCIKCGSYKFDTDKEIKKEEEFLAVRPVCDMCDYTMTDEEIKTKFKRVSHNTLHATSSSINNY